MHPKCLLVAVAVMLAVAQCATKNELRDSPEILDVLKSFTRDYNIQKIDLIELNLENFDTFGQPQPKIGKNGLNSESTQLFDRRNTQQQSWDRGDNSETLYTHIPTPPPSLQFSKWWKREDMSPKVPGYHPPPPPPPNRDPLHHHHGRGPPPPNWDNHNQYPVPQPPPNDDDYNMRRPPPPPHWNHDHWHPPPPPMHWDDDHHNPSPPYWDYDNYGRPPPPPPTSTDRERRDHHKLPPPTQPNYYGNHDQRPPPRGPPPYHEPPHGPPPPPPHHHHHHHGMPPPSHFGPPGPPPHDFGPSSHDFGPPPHNFGPPPPPHRHDPPPHEHYGPPPPGPPHRPPPHWPYENESQNGPRLPAHSNEQESGTSNDYENYTPMIDIRMEDTNAGAHEQEKFMKTSSEIFDQHEDKRRNKLEAYAHEGSAMSAAADNESEASFNHPPISTNFYQAIAVTPEE